MDVVAESGRQILSLLIVFSLLGWTVWKLGRTRLSLPLKRGKVKTLHSVERLMLTPQHTLHLLEFGGQQVLIATHPHGVTLLTPDAPPLARSANA